MQHGSKPQDKNQNARSFVDLAKRHRLQEDVTDSRTDLKLLEAFLRGDQVKDKLPLTHQALEFFKIENAEFANKLKTSAQAADKAKRMVQQKTSQLQRTPGASRPPITGTSKAEELYQKDFDRRKRIEELRQKLGQSEKDRNESVGRSQDRESVPYQGLEAKKQALAQKIMMLQAEKGKTQSNSIVERVFESKYKQELLVTKSGEEVILQSALKERKRRQEPAPADTSMIRKAKLSESRGLSSKSTNVTMSKINKSDLSRSQILDKSSFQRGDSPGSPDKENHSMNKSVTKKKRSGDGHTVYVNYKGEKPPVVPTVSALEQERRRKEEEETQKRLVQQAAEQKIRQEAEAMALRAHREAEEAERAALEDENYDLADEKRKLELIQRQRELERQRARVEESARRKREKNYLEEFLVSKSKQLPSIDPEDPVLARKIAMRAKIEVPDRPLELDPNQEIPKYTKQRVDTRGQALANFRHTSPPPSQSSKNKPAVIPKHMSSSKLSEDTNEIENGFRRFLGVPELGRVQPQYDRARYQAEEEVEPEEPTELNSEEKEEKRIEEAMMKPSLAPVSANPFKTRDAQLKPPAKPVVQKPIATIKGKTPMVPVPVPPLEMEGRISIAGGAPHQGKVISHPKANSNGQGGPESKNNDVENKVNPSKQNSPDGNSKKASAPDFSLEDPAMFDDDEESSEWKGINPYDLAHRSPRKSEVEATSQADHSEFRIKNLSKQRTIGGDQPIEETVKTPRKLPEDLQSKASSHNRQQPQILAPRPGPEEVIQKKVESHSVTKKSDGDPKAKPPSNKLGQVEPQLPVEGTPVPPGPIPAPSSKVGSSSKAKSGHTPPPLGSANLMEAEAFEKYSYRQSKQDPEDVILPQTVPTPEPPAQQQTAGPEETQ